VLFKKLNSHSDVTLNSTNHAPISSPLTNCRSRRFNHHNTSDNSTFVQHKNYFRPELQDQGSGATLWDNSSDAAQHCGTTAVARHYTTTAHSLWRGGNGARPVAKAATTHNGYHNHSDYQFRQIVARIRPNPDREHAPGSIALIPCSNP
jgi:hypothetical protein